MVAAEELITFALPKGTLYKPTIKLLEAAGLDCSVLKQDSRQLLFTVPEQRVRYIICRPTDIPTFVEYGAADFGLVGKDTIVEQQRDVYELLDLKYGGCRFMVAVPAQFKDITLEEWGRAKVATNFPHITENYFRQQGLQMEIIKLHGNIELAPMVGLSDLIVDIVSTGRTLRENNLIPIEEIMRSTARLIANRVSHQYKAVRANDIVESFRKVIDGGLFDD